MPCHPLCNWNSTDQLVQMEPVVLIVSLDKTEQLEPQEYKDLQDNVTVIIVLAHELSYYVSKFHISLLDNS